MKRARTSSSDDESLADLKFLLGDKSVGSLHDFEATSATGEQISMSAYKGKAVLIVNVASL